MRIRVIGTMTHFAYSFVRRKIEWALEELGHTITEEDPELILTIGTSAKWGDIKDLPGRKLFLCHGVDLGMRPKNEPIKALWDNCEVIYSSRFAKHMAEKTFGKKDGPFLLNTSIPEFPETYPTWKPGEPIRVLTCSLPRAIKRVHEVERMVRVIRDEGQEIDLFVVGVQKKSVEPHMHYSEPIVDRDELRKMFQKCHAYIHLSFNDYSPATIGESMAWGIPAISGNSGGAKEVIKDAGIVLDIDPFIDTQLDVGRESSFPPIDEKVFVKGFWRLMNNLEEYQQKVKKQVLKESNIKYQVEKLLEYVNG